MSKSGNIGPIFLDITSLVEYCSIYFDEQHYASKIIDRYYEEGGELVTNEGIELALNKRMNNRKRLWNHLINQANEILRESDSPKQDYKADVLNYTSLQTSMDFDLEEGYLSDVENLREDLDDMSLEEFRNKIDDARLMGKSQRIELENVKEFSKYDGGDRSSWMIKTVIAQYTDSDAQTTSVVNYVYWCQTNTGPLIVGSNSNISKNKEEVEEKIVANMNQISPDIHSCKDIVEELMTN